MRIGRLALIVDAVILGGGGLLILAALLKAPGGTAGGTTSGAVNPFGLGPTAAPPVGSLLGGGSVFNPGMPPIGPQGGSA